MSQTVPETEPAASLSAEKTSDQTTGYGHLPVFDRKLAETVSKPRYTIYAATFGTVVLAWIWLAFLAAGAAGGTQGLGPGMGFVQDVLSGLGIGSLDNTFVQWVLKICAPASANGLSVSAALTGFAMWMMMSVAMMLPSAAPMLRTYSDIADVAAQKGEKVVSVLVLAAGYLAMWAGFCALATMAQLGLISLGAASDPVSPMQGAVGGVLLLAAGAYQFSALKHACLEKCRNPFSIIFGRWSTRPQEIFRLGLEQGAFCIGCCWALMLVMLVVGTMNLAWMAFFTLFTIIEKIGHGKVTSHVSGGILLAWGVALLGASAFGAATG